MTSPDSDHPQGAPRRLAAEKSLYLRLHADNPVDWFPWGDEAFEEAKRRDKPVFLSVGYSTCHWCHVMARESFQDEETARRLNETFVCLKVDREERPDVDAVYMEVAHLLTGSGGWPLTVLLTPDRKPFFAGTYFPRESRPGRVGLKDLASRVGELWRSDRERLLQDAERLVENLRESQSRAPGGDLDEAVMKLAFAQLKQSHDPVNGGFGSGRKFPSPHHILFLLRWWKRSGDGKALRLALSTLEAMAAGGIRDHLGGGFHRYSTDEFWILPHFEKMLYDQALCATAYVEAFLATGRDELGAIAREIFDYVLRDLLLPAGGFAAAEDAESEGVEGRFYLWTAQEILDALGPEEGPFAADVFRIDAQGNFKDEATGRRTRANVLYTGRPDLTPAKRLGLEETGFRRRLDLVKGKLFEARLRRERPRRDEKVLADWNGLMISALARGFQAFGDEKLLEAAQGAADFVLEKMRGGGGRLLHRWAGGEAAVPGFLEDYACLSLGLLDLYEAGFEVGRLDSALSLAREMIALFEAAEGGFFSTAADSPGPLVRRRDAFDGATPSGNSVAMLVLARLSHMTGDTAFEETALRAGRAFSNEVRGGAGAFTQMMCAVDFLAGPVKELVLVEGEGLPGMLAELRSRFLPRAVVLLKNTLNAGPLASIAPFTKGMEAGGGKATAYVCSNFACSVPAAGAASLAEKLEAD